MTNNSKSKSRLYIVIIGISILIIFSFFFFRFVENISYPYQIPSPTSVPPTVVISPTFPSITEIPPTFPSITEISPTVIIPTGTLATVLLPSFPWPVPKPSALEVLTLGSLGKLAGTGVTFRDVDERISSALYSADYDDKSYFGVPGGFAIVTRLEKMDAYGYPDNRYRWASALAPISLTEFSLSDYLKALFGVPKGHYRVFVFVVSSEPVLQSGTPVEQPYAQTWIVEGANRLPSQMEDLPYTREHRTTVYVYEFVQSGIGGDVSFNIPSDFTGRTHLKRAGLWENLNADAHTPTPLPPPLTEIFPQAMNAIEFFFKNNGGVLTSQFAADQTCIHSGVYGLRLVYDMKGQGNGGWGVHWVNPSVTTHFDASRFKNLTFWVKGTVGGEIFQIAMRDTNGNAFGVESRSVLVVTQAWTLVSLPINKFEGVNASSLEEFTFRTNTTHGSGSICIDDMAFSP